MSNSAHQPIYLKDYRSSDFSISQIDLEVDLYETHTDVKATLKIKRNSNQAQKTPLILDGENMVLKAIHLNQKSLSEEEYQVTPTQLIIHIVPDDFTLETLVEIKPQENLRLSGLYKSGENFCTQCESQGFRRITYFLDRPDVLSKFSTLISAEKTRYPVLLSNGNLIDQGIYPKDLKDCQGDKDRASGVYVGIHQECEIPQSIQPVSSKAMGIDGDRHWVKWEDPTLKPAYLFALVAGDLDSIKDIFTTQSGRTVQLFAYVTKGKGSEATYALDSVKESMKWDEEKYGREYDLDIFMIVGVKDFNFGAMENKGLNIFNDKYILAKPEIATDDDYIAIKNVVAHEYFHNWSGNRVTVRDWFQITLKEGFTVFRDQQFTAEKTSPVVKRIQEAKTVRTHQFVQDAGPMAHPIYPDFYIEINNFYTVTVYDKGAEVIRMMHTLLGEKTFRQATDLYFSRHDGHPATAEDFVKAMEDASGMDLTQFWHWYKQAGTPVLEVEDHYDSGKQTYTLTVAQSCPATPNQLHKEPFYLPLVMGLLTQDGKEIALKMGEETSSNTKILHISKPKHFFEFKDITSKPIPSLLRNFSAPVKLKYHYSEADYLCLMQHDSDGFNRWEASQQLAVRITLDAVKRIHNEEPQIAPHDFLKVLKTLLEANQLDPSFMAELLILPSEMYLLEQLPIFDIEAVYKARNWFKTELSIALKSALMPCYLAYQNKKEDLSIGERKLKNVVLTYLAWPGSEETRQLCLTQFQQANNMTDQMAAMVALNHLDCVERTQMLAEFYNRFKNENLVVYKWLACQAQSTLANTLSVVKSLTEHPAFDIKNPNSVRSLIGVFSQTNFLRFHSLKTKGEGYKLITDFVLKLDTFNPQLASRIVEPLIHWKKHTPERQELMLAELERIAKTEKLSSDVYEMVANSLKQVPKIANVNQE